jgi:hypothetical protein
MRLLFHPLPLDRARFFTWLKSALNSVVVVNSAAASSAALLNVEAREFIIRGLPLCEHNALMWLRLS